MEGRKNQEKENCREDTHNMLYKGCSEINETTQILPLIVSKYRILVKSILNI